MVNTDEFRIFEYSRKEKQTGEVKFKAQLVVKGYDIVCFGETVMPSGISEDIALKFFDEAERAVLKMIDSEYENKIGG